MLSPTRGQITHVLLTRAPLYRGRSPFSLDLHVLGAPLTFVLSQDQTLQFESCRLAGQLAPTCCQFFHSDFACRRPGGDTGEEAGRVGDPRYLSRVYVALSFQGPRG